VLTNRVELVTLRLEAAGAVVPPPRELLAAKAVGAAAERRMAWFGPAPVETVVIARTALGAGDRLVGPAIVTQLDATTLVLPGWAAEVLASGALLLRCEV